MEVHKVILPPPKSTLDKLKAKLKEIFFPDDPLRQFQGQSLKRKWLLGAQYIFPILQWGPNYSLKLFKSDVVSGLTIASLAIPQVKTKANMFFFYVFFCFLRHCSNIIFVWCMCWEFMDWLINAHFLLLLLQGISYAKLANLPPIIGLCKPAISTPAFLSKSSINPNLLFSSYPFLGYLIKLLYISCIPRKTTTTYSSPFSFLWLINLCTQITFDFFVFMRV